LEATNQNGEIYMRATLGTQGSKGDPPTELLKNCKKKFGKHVFITKFILRYKTKMKGTLKITKLKGTAQLFTKFIQIITFNYSSTVNKRKVNKN
jgi:hypothetical protein